MGVYEELQERGLIAQTTDENEIRELINSGKAVFYIGFDPTADSLHVGHFIQIIVMMHMQRAGHRPIALLGGGTTMVGDPSGRTDMRKMLTVEQINELDLVYAPPVAPVYGPILIAASQAMKKVERRAE